MTEPARLTVLIVDDDPEIREQLRWAMADKYAVVEAQDRPSAIRQFRAARHSLVILDLGMPPNENDSTEGLKVLEELLAIEPGTKVVVVTGNGDRANARKAIELGGYDILDKPVQVDQLKIILRRAAYVAALEKENRALRDKSERDSFEEEQSERARPCRRCSIWFDGCPMRTFPS